LPNKLVHKTTQICFGEHSLGALVVLAQELWVVVFCRVVACVRISM